MYGFEELLCRFPWRGAVSPADRLESPVSALHVFPSDADAIGAFSGCDRSNVRGQVVANFVEGHLRGGDRGPGFPRRRLAVGPPRRHETLAVTGRVDNLFDKDYENVYGFASPGRGVFAGVRLNFSN